MSTVASLSVDCLIASSRSSKPTSDRSSSCDSSTANDSFKLSRVTEEKIIGRNVMIVVTLPPGTHTPTTAALGRMCGTRISMSARSLPVPSDHAGGAGLAGAGIA